MKRFSLYFILFVFFHAPLTSFATLKCQNVLIAQPAYEAPATRDPFFKYWLDKIRELPHYNISNVYASVLRISIFLAVKKTEVKSILLSKLLPIHVISHGTAVIKTQQRAEALRNGVKENEFLSLEIQNRLIPSKNPMRVVPYGQDRYVVFDGNGRLWAMKEAFGESSERVIEVEHFEIDHAIFHWALRKTLESRGMNPDRCCESAKTMKLPMETITDVLWD